MHFLLIDKNPKMVSAWREIFENEENIDKKEI